MPTKEEALAQVKKQQADAEYLHAVDPNFATLRSGDVYQDTTAGNVLKVKA